MADFTAYYRVSTDRQGASGLRLDAQRQAVSGFVGSGRLVSEFTEIENGRRLPTGRSCSPRSLNAAAAALCS